MRQQLFDTAVGVADGESLAGPLILRESGATTVVGAGWSAARDKLRNLIVSKD